MRRSALSLIRCSRLKRRPTEPFRPSDPPDELAADWQRFIALIDKDAGTFRDALNALHDNDVPRAGRLFAELASASEEEVTASRALGIEACVSSRTKQEPLFK
jgi:hypothetical protein